MMQRGGRERSTNEARHVTERYLGPVRSRAYLTWTNAESTLEYLKRDEEEPAQVCSVQLHAQSLEIVIEDFISLHEKRRV